jgi:Tfp pilus assembly protein PilX
MNPIRETGNSALLMVLMLLLLGLMMLAGLSSHLAAQRQWGMKEVRSIVRYAGAQSALAWGERQHWSEQQGWQCQTAVSSTQRACLYQIKGNEVLLAGFLADDNSFDRLVLWRWGGLKKGKFIARAHGWLDYCPLSDKTRCNLAS